MPPLAWSDDCAEKALVAAQACSAKNTMFHNNHKEHGHGQNIFAYTSGAGFRRPDTAAVHAWYAEVVDPGYVFPMMQPSCPAGTGHFTQVVWKSTTHVGMAWAGDPKTGMYVVANYSPFGNLQGAFPDNVLPPSDGNAAIQQAVAQGKSEEEAFAEEQREKRRKKDGGGGLNTVVLKGDGPELEALLAKIPNFVKSSAPGVVSNIVNNVKKSGVTVEVTLTASQIKTVVYEGNSTSTSEMSWG